MRNPEPSLINAGSKSKKQKTKSISTPIIRQSIISDPSFRKQLAIDFAAAKPYPHCVIKDLCDPELLRTVRDEIVENIQATYKETDLFKMLQTGDLANMDSLDKDSAAKLPTLMALRNAIYSTEFRDFITKALGCGPLSDKTDCACNVHPIGGHLLCHDDVIGDRRVSYIIYLTDPDDGWVERDGGALELYPEDPLHPHTPSIIPTATLLPLWNTMAFFTVEPGRSFHSIQEIYTNEKPRMSIQGWFHAPGVVGNASLATLQQLQARAGEEDAGEYQSYESTTDADLNAEDIEFLTTWINPVYLSDAAAAKIQAQFKEDGSVQLQNFLNKHRADEIVSAITKVDEADEVGCGKIPKYDVGIGYGWRGIGPSHKQRYLRYSPYGDGSNGNNHNGTNNSAGAPSEHAGELLHRVQQDVLSSAAFARLIRRLTTLTMLGHRSEVRRFRPGLDYTVAHYGGLTTDPRMDAVLCFANDRNGDEARMVWESGEVGGFEAYVLADEDEDKPAEVYRGNADDESGVLNVSPASNTLNLVLRDEGLMRFVKYVSGQAPGSRWDVAAVLLPEDDSDDEDEDGGGGGGGSG